MTTKIEPALTAEEWRGSALFISPDDDPKNRHRYAALALHGQPFGFTREDVIRHRQASAWERAMLNAEPAIGSEARAEWHDSMANRIEALLPPEGA